MRVVGEREHVERVARAAEVRLEHAAGAGVEVFLDGVEVDRRWKSGRSARCAVGPLRLAADARRDDADAVDLFGRPRRGRKERRVRVRRRQGLRRVRSKTAWHSPLAEPPGLSRRPGRRRRQARRRRVSTLSHRLPVWIIRSLPATPTLLLPARPPVRGPRSCGWRESPAPCRPSRPTAGGPVSAGAIELADLVEGDRVDGPLVPGQACASPCPQPGPTGRMVPSKRSWQVPLSGRKASV